MRGDFEVIQELLETPEIDVNTTDDQGWTPFHAACSNGHVEVVKLMLENSFKKGIDVKAADQNGNTPIQTACNVIKNQTKVFVPTLCVAKDADPYVNIIILLLKYILPKHQFHQL